MVGKIAGARKVVGIEGKVGVEGGREEVRVRKTSGSRDRMSGQDNQISKRTDEQLRFLVL